MGKRGIKNFRRRGEKWNRIKLLAQAVSQTYGNIMDSARRVRINTRKKNKGPGISGTVRIRIPIKSKKKIFQLNVSFNPSISDLVYI